MRLGRKMNKKYKQKIVSGDTGKVVRPATRFTATLSYGVFVRIEHLDKTLQRNAVLAGTYGKGNETRDHRSQNRKQRDILEWRHVVNLHVLLHLFQECLDMSFHVIVMTFWYVLTEWTYIFQTLFSIQD